MREFFRGWRRKAGCVALVMALAVASAWARSYGTLDGIQVPDWHRQYGIVSMNGGIQAAMCVPVPIANRLVASEWITGPVTDAQRADYWSTLDVEWRQKWCGFDFGAATDVPTGVRFSFAVIPYWSTTIPLTLLSAYLLLWKPRKRAVT